MIHIEAKLVCLTSNPHDEDAPWEAKLCVVDTSRSEWDSRRVFTFIVPLNLEEALELGPHLGQVVAVAIAPQYEPGTVQP